MASVTLRKGDDQTIHGAVTTRSCSGDPQPQDITDWMIWFTVKRRWPDGADAAVVKKQTGGDITITDAPGGLFDVRMRAADLALIPNAPRTYMQYDVQVRNRRFRLRTIGQGELIVLGDITTIP